MSVDIGVTGPQRLVLRVVGLAGRLSPGELAATLHVHPSTLTGLLERLSAQRLILREVDPRDRRRAILRLSSQGRRVNSARTGTAEKTVEDALVHVTPSDRAAMTRVLQQLTRALEASLDA